MLEYNELILRNQLFTIISAISGSVSTKDFSSICKGESVLERCSA
jgi:hypothetical protein